MINPTLALASGRPRLIPDISKAPLPSLLLLGDAPDYSIDTVSELIRQSDLPKVPTWQLDWDSNLRPSGRKAPNLPLSNHCPCNELIIQRALSRGLWASHMDVSTDGYKLELGQCSHSDCASPKSV